MSDPLKPNMPPEDVLPYAPTWARNQDYRPRPQPGASYDAFSDEENPSYRSMAQMFAPEPERRGTATKNASSGKMLLRFGAVVGVAATVLALFVGYVTTKPADRQTANAERFEGVSSAVAAIQAALTPSSAPSSQRPAEAAPAASAKDQAPAPVAAQPAVAPAPTKSATEVATDRGAAPEAPPPVDTDLIPEPAPAAPAAQQSQPSQVAALPSKDEPPAPPPTPIAQQLTAGELATLMERGRRFVASGDFSSARPVYRRAAEAGYAEAALALGETYDPVTLEERGVIGMNPDVAKAREWYERARDLGSLEAPTRLERLPR